MAGLNPTDELLLSLANQPAALGPEQAGQAVGLGASGLGLAPLLGAQQGALGAIGPDVAPSQHVEVAPPATMFDAAPQSVTLPSPPEATPEQIEADRELVANPPQDQGMSGERAQALAMLAGQMPQVGSQIGRVFDRLSDERTKRGVSSADSAVDAFLRALGG